MSAPNPSGGSHFIWLWLPQPRSSTPHSSCSNPLRASNFPGQLAQNYCQKPRNQDLGTSEALVAGQTSPSHWAKRKTQGEAGK